VIQAGLLPAWKVLAASVVCFAACIAIGLRLNTVLHGAPFAVTPLLIIGVAGCVLGAAYTLGPFRLGYRGWGEVAVALGFGPVMLMGAHYVMTAGLPGQWLWLPPLLASLPVAIFVAAIIWINQFPDVPADSRSGKKNWVVRSVREADGVFWYERPWRWFCGLLSIGFGLIVGLGLLGIYVPALSSPFVWLALLPVPIAFLAIRWGRDWLAQWNADGADHKRLTYTMLRINAATILIHAATGLLLIGGYAIWVGA
ncbi:MAG: prenyltransferase, partial [Gammaproteobacteria bacterium]|nr:prenyltransferase [Gammaproteobacteria bacterium]